MNWNDSLVTGLVVAAVLLWLSPRVVRRLQLSRAKHRSLAGHSRMAQRLARWLPGYAYDESRFFCADGAPADVAALRRAGFAKLAQAIAEKSPRSMAITAQAREHLSDLQLTSRYRVPFQFSPYLRSHLQIGGFVEASNGDEVQDLDGNRFIDVTGAYGVNVLGYDAYKQCIDDAVQQAHHLGPVLGPLHPAAAENAAALARLSGMDEVSFHMSGTEAVMQAVRLARYHTRRKYLVRFTGAYHGWWDDVQPGPGNPMPPHETYTLKDMDERALQVIATRKDIACVLVNPLQALHPNRAAPGDSTLVDSSRQAGVDRSAYAAWMKRLREVCTANGIVLILDEIFVGFRLAPRGAQEYFGIQADLVTYGKSLGGGLPVGVLCGKAKWMKRWRDERPADLCFARGTFNAHPYVMTAMQAFLHRLQQPEVLALYDGLDERWNARAARMNQALQAAGVPVRVANLSTIWTVLYTQPSRYNWMLQFYLREHGLLLSWVGSGRMIFTLAMSEATFDEVVRRFVAAALAMQADGWWWPGIENNKALRRQVLREVLGVKLGLRQPGIVPAGPSQGPAAPTAEPGHATA